VLLSTDHGLSNNTAYPIPRSRCTNHADCTAFSFFLEADRINMESIRASGGDSPVNRADDSRRSGTGVLGSGSDLSVSEITWQYPRAVLREKDTTVEDVENILGKL
jgi:hypothetical protein